MKLLKDFIQYYLGCSVKGNEGTMIYTLSGIDRKGHCLFYDGQGNEMWLSDNSWKLLLTPLDKMRPQDTAEISKLIVSLMASTNSIEAIEKAAQLTNHLRSLGYDCDSLIESGLAEDITNY